jgi:hypothetical protein
MEPHFEKANEIYFRLGIIYKQQQKFNQSLDVSPQIALFRSQINIPPVLQIHCAESPSSFDRRGYLVSDRTCLRATKRGK